MSTRILGRAVIVAAIATLAVSALSAPVAALSDPAIAIVQGLPGKTVDVCVDGKEIRSKLKYGKKLKITLTPGWHRIKLFKSDPRTCRGVRLTSQRLRFEANSSQTLVLAIVAGGTGIRVFSDDFEVATSPAPLASAFVIRHAAKAKPVDVYLAQVLVAGDPPIPTIPSLRKGEQFGAVLVVGTYAVWAARAGQLRPRFGPAMTYLKPSRLYQHILIGTKKSNYRMVVFSTPFVLT